METKEKTELIELRRQNKKLRELVNLYNSGVAKIVICNKCGIPLLTDEDRIRVLYCKRGKDYSQRSERQIAVYHIKCFDKKCK